MQKSKRPRRRLAEKDLRMQEEKLGYVSHMALAELSFAATETVSLPSALPLSQLLANGMEVGPHPEDNATNCPSGSTNELANAKGTVQEMPSQRPTQIDQEANQGELQEHPGQASTADQPGQLSDCVHRPDPK